MSFLLLLKLNHLGFFQKTRTENRVVFYNLKKKKKNRKNSLISSIFIFINIVTKNYPTVESYCYCY